MPKTNRKAGPPPKKLLQAPRFEFTFSHEKSYFVENLSMLLAAGMDPLSALSALKIEARTKGFARTIERVERDIDEGMPLWKALSNTKFFSGHVLSLIRIGEQAGRLTENLKVIVVQQQKDRLFKSKVRSAMMYPVFVLGLTLVIGTGIAWFILPRLSAVFSSLSLDLPAITKALIAFGTFIGKYGIIVVPVFFAALAAFFYIVFVHRSTHFIGQALLLRIPAVRKLIVELELARSGYMLGTLLGAGLPIVDALRSLSEATNVVRYSKFYAHLAASVEEGNSFHRCFREYPRSQRLVPVPVQQMIVAGEQSGNLAETLLKIGEIYEGKTDATTKNLTVILEPLLLLIVWFGVLGVAIAVILPIYSLIGGLNEAQEPPQVASPQRSEPPVVITPPVVQMPDVAPDQIDATSTDDGLENGEFGLVVSVLQINETETGFLNLRELPGRTSTVIGRVLPGEKYRFTGEQDGWYQIVLDDDLVGWVLGDYVTVVEDENFTQ